MEELTKEELDKKMSFWKIMERVSIIMIGLGIVICSVSLVHMITLQIETPVTMNNHSQIKNFIESLDSATPILVPEERKSVENLKKLANKKLLEIEDSIEFQNYEIHLKEISAKKSFWFTYGYLIPLLGLSLPGIILWDYSKDNFHMYRRKLRSREK